MAYRYPYDSEEIKYVQSKLKTDRSMWKLMILNILTLGIYSTFFFIPFSFDLDKVDPPRGREKTMNYLAAYFLSLFTFAIVLCVWHYQIAVRIEEELNKREIDYEFTTGDFWKWYFWGGFILVGGFVYFYKLCKAMNLLCQSYNEQTEIEYKSFS